MPSPFDQFLEWLSEQGTGSWDDFKASHAWLFGQSPDMAWRKPGRTAHLLSTLGHLEMSWEQERWSVARPCLVNITNAGGIAVLTGSRPRSLLRRLEAETGAESDLEVMLIPVTPPEGPEVIYLQYEGEADLQRLTNSIGARFERYASRSLLKIVPSLEAAISGSRISADPPKGFDLARFIPSTLRWDAVLSPNSPGLFRYRAYGHDRYWLRRGGRTREVDKDYGMWAALGMESRHVIAHRASGFTGTLIVPMSVPLPLLHARAAVLCSGQPPFRETATRTLHYINVSQKVARQLAQSLDQNLKEEPGA